MCYMKCYNSGPKESASGPLSGRSQGNDLKEFNLISAEDEVKMGSEMSAAVERALAL
jgi:hypothetical protein